MPGDGNPLPRPRGDVGDESQDPGYRAELLPAENIVDPQTSAGGLEDKRAIAPRLRIGRDGWLNLLWLFPIKFLLLVAAVAVGKGLHNMPTVQAFIQRYPGTQQRSGMSTGVPARVGWTHFFNLFLMTFIIRSGIQILCNQPRLYFSRNSTPDKDEWLHALSTVGALILGASMLPFVWNVFRSWRYGEPVTVDDPWGHGNSLEWATSCPPPRHNFTELPRIRFERPAFGLHYPHMIERMHNERHVGRHAGVDAGAELLRP